MAVQVGTTITYSFEGGNPTPSAGDGDILHAYIIHPDHGTRLLSYTNGLLDGAINAIPNNMFFVTLQASEDFNEVWQILDDGGELTFKLETSDGKIYELPDIYAEIPQGQSEFFTSIPDTTVTFFLPEYDPEESTIVFNELFITENSFSTYETEFSQAAFGTIPQYVELFNNTQEDISLCGYSLLVCPHVLSDFDIQNGICREPGSSELWMDYYGNEVTPVEFNCESSCTDICSSDTSYTVENQDNYGTGPEFKFIKNTTIKAGKNGTDETGDGYFTLIGDSVGHIEKYQNDTMDFLSWIPSYYDSSTIDIYPRHIGGIFVEYKSWISPESTPISFSSYPKIIDPCHFCDQDNIRFPGSDINVATVPFLIDSYTFTMVLYDNNNQVVTSMKFDYENENWNNLLTGDDSYDGFSNDNAVGKSIEFTKGTWDPVELDQLSNNPENWRKLGPPAQDAGGELNKVIHGSIFPDVPCTDLNCYDSDGTVYDCDSCPIESGWNDNIQPSLITFENEDYYGEVGTKYNYGTIGKKNWYSCQGEGWTLGDGYCPGGWIYDCDGNLGPQEDIEIPVDCSGLECPGVTTDWDGGEGYNPNGDAYERDNCGVCRQTMSGGSSVIDPEWNNSCRGCTEEAAENTNVRYDQFDCDVSDDGDNGCLCYQYQSTDNWVTFDIVNKCTIFDIGICEYPVAFELATASSFTGDIEDDKTQFLLKYFTSIPGQITNIKINNILVTSAVDVYDNTIDYDINGDILNIGEIPPSNVDGNGTGYPNTVALALINYSPINSIPFNQVTLDVSEVNISFGGGYYNGTYTYGEAEPNVPPISISTLDIDCAGIVGGTTVVDECGVCGGSGANFGGGCCEVDLDFCGVCNGDSTSLCQGATTSCGSGCTCNSDGSYCNCADGWAGTWCQYSNIDNCNSNGDVQNDASCTCYDGYAGNSCQYSDVVDCGDGDTDYGEVDDSGYCTCYDGYAGNSCQYSDELTCNGNGIAQNNGTCECIGEGTSVLVGYYITNTGYYARACDGSDNSLLGLVQEDYVLGCELAFPSICSNYSCNATYYEGAGGTVEECSGDFDGWDLVSCESSRGYCGSTNDGISSDDWIEHDNCSLSVDYCGVCNGDNISLCQDANCGDACTCSSGGDYCNCDTGYNGQYCQYHWDTCNYPGGEIDFSGVCICNNGYAGEFCEYSDEVDCSGNGTVNDDGVCTCDAVGGQGYGYCNDGSGSPAFCTEEYDTCYGQIPNYQSCDGDGCSCLDCSTLCSDGVCDGSFSDCGCGDDSDACNPNTCFDCQYPTANENCLSENSDCTTTTPGSEIYDCSGNCIAEGDNLGEDNGGTGPGLDCSGVCNGDYVIDDCGVCTNYLNSGGSQPSYPYGTCDCAGTPDGSAGSITCEGDTPCHASGEGYTVDCAVDMEDAGCYELSGCDETCDSILEFDECGVCDGDGKVYYCDGLGGDGVNICDGGVGGMCESELSGTCYPVQGCDNTCDSVLVLTDCGCGEIESDDVNCCEDGQGPGGEPKVCGVCDGSIVDVGCGCGEEGPVNCGSSANPGDYCTNSGQTYCANIEGHQAYSCSIVDDCGVCGTGVCVDSDGDDICDCFDDCLSTTIIGTTQIYTCSDPESELICCPGVWSDPDGTGCVIPAGATYCNNNCDVECISECNYLGNAGAACGEKYNEEIGEPNDYVCEGPYDVDDYGTGDATVYECDECGVGGCNNNDCSSYIVCPVDTECEENQNLCDDSYCVEIDECGVCGGNGIAGCMDENACSGYNSSATCDPDEECIYSDFCSEPYPTCSEGLCICEYGTPQGDCDCGVVYYECDQCGISTCGIDNCTTYEETNPCTNHGMCGTADTCDISSSSGCTPIDECGVCGGDDTSCADCAGVPNGTSQTWECDQCICGNDVDGNPIAPDTGGCIESGTECVQDCAGTWGGSLVDDQCGVCDGDNSTCTTTGCFDASACNYYGSDCTDIICIDEVCDYPEENFDCDGNCIVDIDCTGECGGDVEIDECDVCGGDNTSCCNDNGEYNGSNCICGSTDDFEYCNDVIYGCDKIIDNCGVCVEIDDDTCTTDCNGDYCNNNTIACVVNDNCDVCGGDNTSCCNDNGEYNGSNCVCYNSSGTGFANGSSGDYCNNDVYGCNSQLDDCLICGGSLFEGSSWCGGSEDTDDQCCDCAGVINGTSTVDNCGICDSDNTNDCIQDCGGIWGGDLEFDLCGVCGGDGSSCCNNACEFPWGCNGEGDCDQCIADIDCNGDCGGSAVEDICGVCNGDNIDTCGSMYFDLDHLNINKSNEGIYTIPIYFSCVNDIGKIRIPLDSSNSALNDVQNGFVYDDHLGNLKILLFEPSSDTIEAFGEYGETLEDYVYIIEKNYNADGFLIDTHCNNESFKLGTFTFTADVDKSIIYTYFDTLDHPRIYDLDNNEYGDGDGQTITGKPNIQDSDEIKLVYGCMDGYSGLADNFADGQLYNNAYTETYNRCDFLNNNIDMCTEYACNEWTHQSKCDNKSGENCCCDYPVVEIDRIEYDYNGDDDYEIYMASDSDSFPIFEVSKSPDGTISISDFKYYWKDPSNIEHGYDIDTLINTKIIKYILDSEDNIVSTDTLNYSIKYSDADVDDGGYILTSTMYNSCSNNVCDLPSGNYKLVILWPANSIDNIDTITLPNSDWIKSKSELNFQISRTGCTVDKYDGNAAINYNYMADISDNGCLYKDIWHDTAVCPGEDPYINHWDKLDISNCNAHCQSLSEEDCITITSTCSSTDMYTGCGNGHGICGEVKLHKWYLDSDDDGYGCLTEVTTGTDTCPSITFPLGYQPGSPNSHYLYGGSEDDPVINIDINDIVATDYIDSYGFVTGRENRILLGTETGDSCLCTLHYHCPSSENFSGYFSTGYISEDTCNSSCADGGCEPIDYIKDSCDLCKPDYDGDGNVDSDSSNDCGYCEINYIEASGDQSGIINVILLDGVTEVPISHTSPKDCAGNCYILGETYENGYTNEFGAYFDNCGICGGNDKYMDDCGICMDSLWVDSNEDGISDSVYICDNSCSPDSNVYINDPNCSESCGGGSCVLMNSECNDYPTGLSSNISWISNNTWWWNYICMKCDNILNSDAEVDPCEFCCGTEEAGNLDNGFETCHQPDPSCPDYVNSNECNGSACYSGPTTGCDCFCNEIGASVPEYDDIGGCCYESSMVNYFPDIDETIGVGADEGAYSGESGFCSNLLYPNQETCEQTTDISLTSAYFSVDENNKCIRFISDGIFSSIQSILSIGDIYTVVSGYTNDSAGNWGILTGNQYKFFSNPNSNVIQFSKEEYFDSVIYPEDCVWDENTSTIIESGMQDLQMSKINGTWIFLNVLKICDLDDEENFYVWEGGSELKCSTVNEDGVPIYNNVSSGLCEGESGGIYAGWETQPSPFNDMSLTYRRNIDLCDGYIDDCGDCWDSDPESDCYGEPGAGLYNSSKDCAGVCGGDSKIDDCGVCMLPNCISGSIDENKPHWSSNTTFPNTHIACDDGYHPSEQIWNAICTGCTDGNATNKDKNCAQLNPETQEVIYTWCKFSCDGNTTGMDYNIDGIEFPDYWEDSTDISLLTDYIDSHINNACCDSFSNRMYFNCCCEYSFFDFSIDKVDLNGDGIINEIDKFNDKYINGLVTLDQPYNRTTYPVNINWRFQGPIDTNNNQDYLFKVYRGISDLSYEDTSASYLKASECNEYGGVCSDIVWNTPSECMCNDSHLGAVYDINANTCSFGELKENYWIYHGCFSDGFSYYTFKDHLLYPVHDTPDEPWITEQTFFSYYVELSANTCGPIYTDVIGLETEEGDGCEYGNEDCVWNEDKAANVEVTSPVIYINSILTDKNGIDDESINVDWNPFSELQTIPWEEDCYQCYTSPNTIKLNITYENLSYYEDYSGGGVLSWNIIALYFVDVNGDVIFKKAIDIDSESGSLISDISDSPGVSVNNVWDSVIMDGFYQIKLQYPGDLDSGPDVNIISYDYNNDDTLDDYWLRINVVEGCMWDPESGTLCDCIDCFDLCVECLTEFPPGGWESGQYPDACMEPYPSGPGFPNPYATVDFCNDGVTPCNFPNDPICGDESLCDFSCALFINGCMDDGNQKPGGCITPTEIECETDDTCGDGFFCGIKQDDDIRYCQLGCRVIGDTSECTDYGGTCDIIPGTYINNMGFYGSVLNGTNALNYYTAQCDECVDGNGDGFACGGSNGTNDGYYNTLEECEDDTENCLSCKSFSATTDNGDCKYEGCLIPSSNNWYCNLLPEGSDCNDSYWTSCGDCCSFEFQFRLKYGIEVNENNYILPNGELYGFIDFGLTDNFDQPYVIQLPLPGDLPPGATYEFGGQSKRLQFELIGRSNDPYECDESVTNNTDPYYCVGGQRNDTFNPNQADSSDSVGFPITRGIMASGGSNNAWELPSFFQEVDPSADDEIDMTGICACDPNNSNYSSCVESNAPCQSDMPCAGDDKVCVHLMKKFDIPDYDICLLTTNEPFDISITLTDPDNSSNTVTKTFQIKLVGNDYEPVLARGDSAAVIDAKMTSDDGLIHYDYLLTAYDLDKDDGFYLEHQVIDSTIPGNESLLQVPEEEWVVNGPECICDENDVTDCYTDIPPNYPVHITANPDEGNSFTVVTNMVQPVSDILIDTWGCSNMFCYGDPSADSDCENLQVDEFWTECGNGGNCVYQYCSGDCKEDQDIDDGGGGCSGHNFCSSTGLGNSCIPVKIPLHQEYRKQVTWGVQVIDTRGPDGSVVAMPDDVFGISQDTWTFTFAGPDNRDIIGGHYTEVPQYNTGILSLNYVYGSWMDPTVTNEYEGDGNFSCQEINQSYILNTGEISSDLVATMIEELQSRDIIDCELNCEDDQSCIENCRLNLHQYYLDTINQWDNPTYTCISGDVDGNNDNHTGYYYSSFDECDSDQYCTFCQAALRGYEEGNLCLSYVSYEESYIETTWTDVHTEYVYNPNFGGWRPYNAYHEPSNMTGNKNDTVWMYKLKIQDGDGNLIAEKEWKDWNPDTLADNPLYPSDWSECVDYTLDDINDVCEANNNSYMPPPNSYLSNSSSQVADAIETGYTHQFTSPGIYKISGSAYDLAYHPSEDSGTNPGEMNLEIDIPYILDINQSVGDTYLPWQGINIPQSNVQYVRNGMDTVGLFNRDTRIPLGCFYERDSITRDWSEIAQDQISGPLSGSYHIGEVFPGRCDSQSEEAYQSAQKISINQVKILNKSGDGNPLSLLILNSDDDNSYSYNCTPNQWRVLTTFGESDIQNIDISSYGGAADNLGSGIYLSMYVHLTDKNYYIPSIEYTSNGENDKRGFSFSNVSPKYHDWRVGWNYLELNFIDDATVFTCEPECPPNLTNMNRLQIYRNGCTGGFPIEFTPDVDIRTPMTMANLLNNPSSQAATPFNYYDSNLSPNEFYETVSPTEVQLWFYKRESDKFCSDSYTVSCIDDNSCKVCSGNVYVVCENNETCATHELAQGGFDMGTCVNMGTCEDKLFSSRNKIEFTNNPDTYIFQLDWGDGSKNDFDTEPFLIGNRHRDTVIRHSYKRSGIYEITGYMVQAGVEYDLELKQWRPIGVMKNDIFPGYKRFKIFINLNRDDKDENSFQILGGTGFRYIPHESDANYGKSTPILGGISPSSVYIKSIKQKLGYINGLEEPIDISWPYYVDKLDAEYALASVDETLIGKNISNYTGSKVNSTNITNLTDPSGNSLTIDENISGFYAASSVDPDTGELSGNAVLIHTGMFKNYGELGKYPGKIDVGQFRYFSTGNITMWEMLGFESDEAGIPDNPRYWERIIPEDYDVTLDRYGVSVENFIKTVSGHFSDWSKWSFWGDETYWNQNTLPPKQYNDSVDGVDSVVFEGITALGGRTLIYDNYLYNFSDIDSVTFSILIKTDLPLSKNTKFSIINSDGNSIGEISKSIDIGIEWVKYQWTVNLTQVGNAGIELEITDVANTRFYFSNPMLVSGTSTDPIEINPYANQTWFGDYYYPVLPRINAYGKFDYDNLGLQGITNIPFGDKETWDSEDTAPVTDGKYQNRKLIIDLNLSTSNEESMEDHSGTGTTGIVIGDYIVDYDDEKIANLVDNMNVSKVNKDDNGKAF